MRRKRQVSVKEEAADNNIVQKGLQILLLLGCLLALLGGIYALHNPQLFPISEVTVVTSYQHIKPEALQAVIIPFTEKSFFALNVHKLQQQLLQLQWVYRVAITRKWPGRLVIKVIEQTAVARFNHSSLVNSAGDIFVPKDFAATTKVLPELIGSENFVRELLKRYWQMYAEFKKLGLTVKKLKVDQYHHWSVVLGNGMLVSIGNHHVMQRLSRFLQSYPKIVGGHGDMVAEVNLHYNNGFAIRWKK